MAVAWAVVAPLVSLFYKPGLTASVQTQLSRAEATQEILRYIESEKWKNLLDKVSNGMFWFSSCELWKDAEQWLQRFKEGDIPPEERACWQTMIAVGQGNYALAPNLERLLPQIKWDSARKLTAVAYAKLGRGEDALRVIQAAEKLRPKKQSHWQGDVYAALSQWEMALSCYEHANRSAETLHGMAACLTRLGEHREARALYRQAIQLSLYIRPDYLRELAVCCQRLGDERLGREAERLALEHED